MQNIATVAFMKSQNFEFLRARREFLADLAGFAEAYTYSDPVSALLKQRTFVELVVRMIFDEYNLVRPFSDALNDWMNEWSFRDSVPTTVQNMLHAIRKAGNAAAHHPETVSAPLALERLYQLFQLASWVHLTLDRGAHADLPRYAGPSAPTMADGTAKKALDDVLAKLKIAEAKYEELLQKTQREREAAESLAKQNATVVPVVPAPTTEELEQRREAGQRVANVLAFNEETTRRKLIDQLLLEAGWNVGRNGADTAEVRQEVQLTGMPSDSGDGRADYVLYGDDGQALAVIEAKRTAKDASVGREQARLYALCLEKLSGRRPVIFYTNGIDIFLWDDFSNSRSTPRKIWGMYSKNSLVYLLHRRVHKHPLATVAPNLTIADRMYQLEAIKRVCERFSTGKRKALLVQATGTGKTRVAISLCETMLRAGWVKRILFLCDRRELRRQADRVFKEFLPGEPRVIVGSSPELKQEPRIYLATYPAMMERYTEFDVGFFDLVIADESHRSIYNKYRSLFKYFDSLQVGLTATPIGEIERNTYELFECEEGDPTSHYSYQDAVASVPPHLAPFRVLCVNSWVREDGLRWSKMNREQREKLEAKEDSPETVEQAPEDLDRSWFNKPTTAALWRTLMHEGIKDTTGSRVGKTIVFARSHKHAEHLMQVFYELYPELNRFCVVIDNQVSHAESLIDDFKSTDPARDNPIHIAISVDMLDTGIDIPEVVNLVFAKPVRSFVKFWQMIGRGTRLCRDLFGPGRDKSEFLIFDHWQNFWFFDEAYTPKEPSKQKSLLQRVFEQRVALAEAALEQSAEAVFQCAVDRIVDDVSATRKVDAIDVRERWRELEQLSNRELIAGFALQTKADLLLFAAPLMSWQPIEGFEAAYRFDLLMTRLQTEWVTSGPRSQRTLDLRGHVENAVESLMKNQGPVKAKAATILQVQSKEFWADVTFEQLETVRTELRGIMQYQRESRVESVGLRMFDIEDEAVMTELYVPKLEGLDLVAYKQRVEAVLKTHFADNATLRAIREGKSVRDEDLEVLARLVLEVDDRANVKQLIGNTPETRRSLLAVFRGLVGLDPQAVEQAFSDFVHKHPTLSAQQLHFLQLVQNHIVQNGGIEIDRLYEAPFTTINANGLDDVFSDPHEAEAFLAILSAFEPQNVVGSRQATTT
jgi:type I restriction enzyme R subunit